MPVCEEVNFGWTPWTRWECGRKPERFVTPMTKGASDAGREMSVEGAMRG